MYIIQVIIQEIMIPPKNKIERLYFGSKRLDTFFYKGIALAV